MSSRDIPPGDPPDADEGFISSGRRHEHRTSKDGTECPDERWSIKDAYRTRLLKDGDPWEACFKKVQKLDDEMCRGWGGEIDTMLIFAGLFSATVTAFVTKSYQWLEETPSDTLARLQLQKLIGEQASPPRNIEFVISPSAVWINALWFSSLTLALGSALVGILCKQWIYEYQRYENLTGEKSLPIREMRYKGLQGWHVPGIISSLPLLLQTALVLFFVGILILLWPLQRVVASIITIIVGTTLIFLIATSLLPAVQRLFRLFDTQCAFKSPQSWAFILFTWSGSSESTWTQYDSYMVNWERNNHILSSLNRFYELFSQNIGAVRNIYHCIAGSGPLAFQFVETLDNNASWDIRPIPPSSRAAFAHDDIEKIQRDIALSFFSAKLATKDLNMFHRHAEHCVRLLGDVELMTDVEFCASRLQFLGDCVSSATALSSPLDWDPGIAFQLISIFSSMFKGDRMPDSAALQFWNDILPSLLAYGSRQRDKLARSPFLLFDDIGPWLTRYPMNALKVDRVEECIYGLQLMTVTGIIDKMNSEELGYVKTLLPIMYGIHSGDPNTYAPISQDLDLLLESFHSSATPHTPLYSVSHLNTEDVKEDY